ncbi:hypothetical protein [Permianibacter aggregans]|uniref:GTPase n=1 Tax=Permianibacter aggregans TaxID=1510150 RepID=A0A4R6UHY5_9GAMM|nr:hypothetical protein [Permianibacter aggregans]QGX40605.1 hypothetical protein E2H98_13375 [Permianibacter aggregans]TDQ46468.1 hypothetical protein EV696_1139 [Permianibacter aggregans]
MRTGQLGLSIREISTLRQSAVGLSHRAVVQWLDALPIANTGESARQIYQFLVDINSQRVSVDERLQIMLTLRKTVSLINDALRKHYLGQSVSLNDKQRKIAALAQAMQSEMAIGFKTVVEDMMSDHHPRIQPNVLVPAVYHSIAYLSRVLVRCYQLYSQHPGRIWKELHTLFVFAEQNMLHRQPVDSDDAANSIERAYFRILLLAAANPYQLRQKEIDQLFDAAGELSAECHLQSYEAGAPLMVVDLDGDNGPLSQGQLTPKAVGQYRQLQLNDVIARIQDDLRSTGTVVVGSQRTATQQLGAPLLRHLVNAYGNQSTRSFSRTPANGTLKIAIGLSATHYLLSGKAPRAEPEPAVDELSAMSGSLLDATLVDDDRIRARYQTPSNAATRDYDPFAKLYRSPNKHDAQKHGDITAQSARNFTQNKEVSYDFHVAALINISPGGYCLAMRGAVPVQTQTGEIIGIVEQSESGESHWNIGTIRWMKRLPDGTLNLGVQLIAPSARPVETQVRNSQATSNSFQRALLLPALKGIGQPATLITSPIPYSIKQKVRIKESDKSYDVQLNKLVAASASYRQFQFSDALSQTEVRGDSKPGDPENFDNLWELI